MLNREPISESKISQIISDTVYFIVLITPLKTKQEVNYVDH